SEELKADRKRTDDNLATARKRVASTNSDKILSPWLEAIKAVDKDIEKRKEELRHEMSERKRVAAEVGWESLKSRVARLDLDEREGEAMVRTVQAEVRVFKPLIEAEMLRVEIARDQELLKVLGAEIEHSKIELPPESEVPSGRISLLSKATPARFADGKSR